MTLIEILSILPSKSDIRIVNEMGEEKRIGDVMIKKVIEIKATDRNKYTITIKQM